MNEVELLTLILADTSNMIDQLDVLLEVVQGMISIMILILAFTILAYFYEFTKKRGIKNDY